MKVVEPFSPNDDQHTTKGQQMLPSQESSELESIDVDVTPRDSNTVVETGPALSRYQ